MIDETMSDSPHVEVIGEKWAQIPETLLYDQSVSDGAVRIFGVLHRYGTDPRNCYPSHRTIAERIGKSQRSIPRLVRELEDAGWVEVIHRTNEAGDPTSNAYRLHMGGRANLRGVRAESRGGVYAESRGPSAQNRAPNESHRNESHRNESRAAALPGLGAEPFDRGTGRVGHDLAFEQFWEAYPRHTSKIAARQAWDKAIRRAPDHVIVAGARRHRDDPNREAQYTKHPATWLNQGCWDDDPLPARRNGGSQQRPSTRAAPQGCKPLSRGGKW